MGASGWGALGGADTGTGTATGGRAGSVKETWLNMNMSVTVWCQHIVFTLFLIVARCMLQLYTDIRKHLHYPCM
jgi:hypothetical protein